MLLRLQEAWLGEHVALGPSMKFFAGEGDLAASLMGAVLAQLPGEVSARWFISGISLRLSNGGSRDIATPLFCARAASPGEPSDIQTHPVQLDATVVD